MLETERAASTLETEPSRRSSPPLGGLLRGLTGVEERFWGLVVVVGLVSGLGAVVLFKVLHVTQHLFWRSGWDAAAARTALGRRVRLLDVFACVECGGRRRVLAYVTAPSGVRSLLEHLGLPSRPAKRAPAQGPPQRAWC